MNRLRPNSSKLSRRSGAERAELLLQRLDPPGGSDTVSYSLLGLAAVDYPPDAMTDAMVVNVAKRNFRPERWLRGGDSRAPIQEGDIPRRPEGILVLQRYGPPGLQSRIRQARRAGRAYCWKLSPRPPMTARCCCSV